jgi:hypothetical protein
MLLLLDSVEDLPRLDDLPGSSGKKAFYSFDWGY